MPVRSSPTALARQTSGARHAARRSVVFGLALLVAASACFLKGKPGELPPPREPIPVRVRNDNFLDVNVYMNVGSQTRRLGTVPGNSTAKFTVDWAATTGQPIFMTAFPIGSREYARSDQLSVGMGQAVFFTVASVLRQSFASLGEP